MHPAEFVQELARAAPNSEALARVGIVGDEASNWQRCYKCLPRQRGDAQGYVDCAIALVDNWDASQIDIGMVRFDRHSSPCVLGTQIGVMEIDPLVVTSDTGEVVVVDENEPTFVMWHAAEDGAKLLHALVLAARFCTLSLLKEVDDENFPAARAAATECANAAGGEKYKDFYWMLLGAEP